MVIDHQSWQHLRKMKLLVWLLRRQYNRAIFCVFFLATCYIASLGRGVSLDISIVGNDQNEIVQRAEGVTSANTMKRNSRCPKLIQQRKGVYNTTSKGEDKFRDVVLMTAVNHQFENYLQNWEIISGELGLQWVVLSFDNITYDLLGGAEGSIPLAQISQVERAGKFGSQSYIQLVCNKLRMVLEILEECNVSIVFTDVDNVFLKDPFRDHFGSMIASGRYDYIYQVNDMWTDKPYQHSCITEGTVVLEGNTGFHYLRPSQNMKEVLVEALQRCDKPGNIFDDQTNLWNVLHEKLNGTSGNRKWKHCPPFAFNRTDSATAHHGDEGMTEICCLDPHYYATGGRRPTNQSALVTFHANWGPRSKKRMKLKNWITNGWRLPW